MPLARTFLVCPFHRPGDLQNVLENCGRQRTIGTLVLVGNGRAMSDTETLTRVTESVEAVGGRVLTCVTAHQSAAKNTALDWIARSGGGTWLTLDSDDWYGPDYVSETLAALERGPLLVGKSAPYWLTQDGREVWRGVFGSQGGRSLEFLAGGTLASHTDTGLRFRDTGTTGEDWDLVRRAVRSGLCWSTPSEGYLWRRDCSEHTCRVSDVQLRETCRQGVTAWQVAGLAEAIALASGSERRAGEHRCSRGCAELGHRS